MAGRNWAGGDGRDAGALLYPPPAPRARDHHKENIRNMRQAANQKRQEKQEERREQQRPAFKNPNLANVRAKVDRSGHAKAGAAYDTAKPVPGGRIFLKAGEKKHMGAPPAPSQPYAGRRAQVSEHALLDEHAPRNTVVPKQSDLPPVPKAHEQNRLRREKRDYEAQHALELNQMAQQKAVREREAAEVRRAEAANFAPEKGRVPEYLRHRKEELREEQQYLQKQMAPAPAGYKPLAEDQRRSLLEQLQKAFAAKSVELQRMPLVCESVSRRRRKAELEGELVECERTIKILSKPVFVDPGGGLTNDSGAGGARGPISWEAPLQ